MSNPGLDVLRQQLAADSVNDPIALLTQAMQLGQAGLDLVVEALHHKAIPVQMAAYEMLRDRPETDIQWQRLWYSPYMVIQSQFDQFQTQVERGDFTQFAITPDSQKLLTVDYYGDLHLWDIKTGELIHTLRGDGSFGYPKVAGWGKSKLLGAIALHPHGQTVWIATHDGVVQERDWMTGETKRTLQSNIQWINSLALDASGRFLLVGSGSFYGAELWDLTTGEVKLCFEKMIESAENAVAIAPDASVLAVGGWNQVKLWDLQGNLLHTFEGQRGTFVPNRPTLVLYNVSLQQLQIYDVQTGACLRQFHEPHVRNFAVTSDGQAIVIKFNHSIKVRSLATGEVLKVVRTACSHSKNSHRIAISPDQYKIVTGEIQVFWLWRTIILGPDVSPSDLLHYLQRTVGWREAFDPRFKFFCYTEEALIRDYCRLAKEFGLPIAIDDLRQRIHRLERIGYSEDNYYQYRLEYNKPRTLPLEELDMNRPDIDEKYRVPFTSERQRDYERSIPYNNTEYCP